MYIILPYTRKRGGEEEEEEHYAEVDGISVIRHEENFANATR